MSKRQDYKYVGSRRTDFYTPIPPKKENPWPAIFGVGFVVLLIMGACAG